MEAHRQSLTRWTNRAFLQKCRTSSCSKQESSDMPAILLLKDEAVRRHLPIKRSHMHLEGCKRKQLQNKVKPQQCHKERALPFPFSASAKPTGTEQRVLCFPPELQRGATENQKGLRWLRVDSDSMQASSLKIKAAIKL